MYIYTHSARASGDRSLHHSHPCHAIIFLCVCVCVCVCLFILYVYIICIYTYICTHTYIYIYLSIHTHSTGKRLCHLTSLDLSSNHLKLMGQLVEILKIQLAARFTIWKNPSADMWEFLLDSIGTNSLSLGLETSRQPPGSISQKSVCSSIDYAK